jgi:hypothetical protein
VCGAGTAGAKAGVAPALRAKKREPAGWPAPCANLIRLPAGVPVRSFGSLAAGHALLVVLRLLFGFQLLPELGNFGDVNVECHVLSSV